MKPARLKPYRGVKFLDHGQLAGVEFLPRTASLDLPRGCLGDGFLLDGHLLTEIDQGAKKTMLKMCVEQPAVRGWGDEGRRPSRKDQQRHRDRAEDRDRHVHAYIASCWEKYSTRRFAPCNAIGDGSLNDLAVECPAAPNRQ